jgi:hypothetical protein
MPNIPSVFDRWYEPIMHKFLHSLQCYLFLSITKINKKLVELFEKKKTSGQLYTVHEMLIVF